MCDEPSEPGDSAATLLKIDQPKEDAAVELLEGGATMAIAARGIGVHRATLYRHMERSPAFAVRVQDAKDLADDAVEAEMYLIATGRKVATSKGQITAQIFWLKNRRPKQWRDVHGFSLDTPDGSALVEGSALAAMAALFVVAPQLTEGARSDLEALPRQGTEKPDAVKA